LEELLTGVDWTLPSSLHQFNSFSIFSNQNISSNNSSAVSTTSSQSPFDTQNFPTTVKDISSLIEDETEDFNLDATDPTGVFCENSKENMINKNNAKEVILSEHIVPVIHVEDTDSLEEDVSESGDNEDEDMEDDMNDEDDEKYLHPRRIPRSMKRSWRNNSLSTDETDSDWEPSPERKRNGGRRNNISTTDRNRQDKRMLTGRISKTRTDKIIPQRRSPTAKMKITQWIVKQLRNPEVNPRVVTWVQEDQGIFSIQDSAEYARLWGEFKGNTKMNYEKFSRAMRYSYKNDELRMVPSQRLTYQFGPSMTDYRALDPTDPNFTKYHNNNNTNISSSSTSIRNRSRNSSSSSNSSSSNRRRNSSSSMRAN
jgi:hypothetical protein